MVEAVLHALDYLNYLAKYFKNAAERRENIAELIRFAGQFDRLEDLLEQITLLQATDTIQEAGDRESKRKETWPGTDMPPVTLMTIHLAKGLEFDRVFVAGASEGLLPHSWSLETEAELEEERRLLYVAMTRAKKELFISFYDHPSRFLSELPPELLVYENLVRRDADWDPDSEERWITLD